MLADEIKKLIEGEISVDPADLQKYSQDASIFEVRPQVIVFPKNVDDLKRLVQYVARHKLNDPDLSLTARAGGTDMSGGSLNDSIILDFTRHLNKIDPVENESVSTQPGAFYRDLEKVTLKRGLLLPCYPASKLICTIGGMVANNSAGEKSLSYGQTKDYVEEIRAVLYDGQEYTFRALDKTELDKKLQRQDFEGQLYRDVYKLIEDNYDLIQKAKPNTSKNSAGYYLWNVWDRKTFNLAQLFTGSQGTLGLITKTKLRLVRPAPKSELLVMFLDDLSLLGQLVHTVLQHQPETFESYDKHTLKLAVKYLPGMVKKMKGNIFKLAWQFLPEFWMVATGGVPNLVLIAEFTGEDEAGVGQRIAALRAEVERRYHIKTHATHHPEETQKYWTIRRESFNLLRQHSAGKDSAPFIDDIVVHPGDLPEFLPKLYEIFSRYPSLVYTMAGHAGDANFHIIPIMDLRNEKERAIVPALSHAVYDLVLQYHGSIAAEHNDGLIRTPYLEKMYGPEVTALFAKVKQIFDPGNIFNPRKKVGGTEEYALAHIKR